MNSIEGLTQQIQELTELTQSQVRTIEEKDAENRRLSAALDTQGELTQKYQALALEAAQGAPQQHAQAALSGVTPWKNRQYQSHTPDMALSDRECLSLAEEEIADLRTILAQRAASKDSKRDAEIARLRSELILAESAIASMQDSLEGMADQLNEKG